MCNTESGGHGDHKQSAKGAQKAWRAIRVVDRPHFLQRGSAEVSSQQ